MDPLTFAAIVATAGAAASGIQSFTEWGGKMNEQAAQARKDKSEEKYFLVKTKLSDCVVEYSKSHDKIPSECMDLFHKFQNLKKIHEK